MMLAAKQHPTAPSNGARLVNEDGTRDLPLRATHLRVRACGGYARVVLEQRFTNPWPEPLIVTYALPLPHDGAVSGFSFGIGERRVVGEVDTLEDARNRFEQAMLDGRSAGLLEQERGSLFTQQLGNIPPGEDILAEIVIDQPLHWRQGGNWEWRFPLVAAPRYLGGANRVPDADRLVQDVTTSGDGPELGFEVLIDDALAGTGEPRSPSHKARTLQVGRAWKVVLDPADAGKLDRDLIVCWPVAFDSHRITLDLARPAPTRTVADSSVYGVLSITPPTTIHPAQAVARDLILLIDTSGSMEGPPLEQAKAVAAAVIDSLGDGDGLEMVEFSNRPRRWRASPEPATPTMIGHAKEWLAKLEAGGATEMVSGLREALRPRRVGAQRQIILITDGLVGFESEVVQTLRDALPPGSRVHSVGVGPASNRSLTAACARAGRGIEVQAASGDNLDAVIATLKSRLTAPLVTNLVIAGDALIDVAPRALPDLYAGSPFRVAVKLRPEGGRIIVSGKTSQGTWRDDITAAPVAAGKGSASLARYYAREVVEDLEIDLAAGDPRAEIDARIQRIGCDYQIATRLTAWIAVSEEPDVDPRKAFRRVRQPQRLPHGLSAEGLGLAPFVSPIPPAESMLSSLTATPRAIRPPSDMQVPGYLDFAFEDEARPTPRSPRVRLVARSARHTEDAWIFLIDVLGTDFVWRHPDRVEVVWADDLVQVGELLGEQTTEPGTVAAGATIRLAVRLPPFASPSKPEALVLTSVLYGNRRIRVKG